MMRNNGLLALCSSTQAVPLAAGWRGLTRGHRMTVPGLAVVATFQMEGYRPATMTAGD